MARHGAKRFVQMKRTLVVLATAHAQLVVGGSSGRGFSSRSASSLVDLFQFIALIGHKPLCQSEVDIQRR